MKDFINTLGITNEFFVVNESEWDQFKQLHDTLFHCYQFTKKIQGVQETLSDFYADWIDLKLKLNKNASHEFAKMLIECMKERENVVHKNATLLSALFFDTRYRVFLNNKSDAKQIAINHLCRLWRRICQLKDEAYEEENDSDQLEINQTTVNDLDAYLDSLEGSSNLREPSSTFDDIMFKLQNFDRDISHRKRDPKTNHPLDFWKIHGGEHPELNELANVVYAASPTEVSVERNFSALTFIFNRYRCNLTDENLNDILFIRLNKDIFYEII